MATKQNEPIQGSAIALSVIAKREGFRRGGHTFGSEPKQLFLVDLSKAQIEAIRSEPMLFVTEVTVTASQASEK